MRATPGREGDTWGEGDTRGRATPDGGRHIAMRATPGGRAKTGGKSDNWGRTTRGGKGDTWREGRHLAWRMTPEASYFFLYHL